MKSIPFVLKNETIIFCDTDQTLVVWHKDHNKPGKGKRLFVDPYTGDKLYLRPHKVHCRLLRQYKARGFGIVVASKAGYLWSKEVVNQLGLNDIVDLIMSKPDRFMDDKNTLEDIVGNRVYLEDRESD